MNSVTCPACGANAKNLQNCEYCGSLFVRIYENNYNLDQKTIDEIQSDSFPGLDRELTYNLSLRKKYECDWFKTGIYLSKDHWKNFD